MASSIYKLPRPQPPSAVRIHGLHSGPFGSLNSFCLTKTYLHIVIPTLQTKRYRDGVAQALSQGGMVGVVKYKAWRLLKEDGSKKCSLGWWPRMEGTPQTGKEGVTKDHFPTSSPT